MKKKKVVFLIAGCSCAVLLAVGGIVYGKSVTASNNEVVAEIKESESNEQIESKQAEETESSIPEKEEIKESSIVEDKTEESSVSLEEEKEVAESKEESEENEKSSEEQAPVQVVTEPQQPTQQSEPEEVYAATENGDVVNQNGDVVGHVAEQQPSNDNNSGGSENTNNNRGSSGSVNTADAEAVRDLLMQLGGDQGAVGPGEWEVSGSQATADGLGPNSAGSNVHFE